MPRTDNPIDVPQEDIPHTIEVDDSENMVGTSLARIKQILKKAEKPGDALALFMVYKTYYQERKRVASVPTLIKILGWGKDKLRAARKELMNLNIIEDIKIKGDDGRFIATKTRLRGTDFPTVGKHPPYIINNIDTPDSVGPESGCVCSSCSCHGEVPPKKETPTNKELPREQDFNDLWSANRHKVNKEEARKAWKSKPVQKSLPPKDVLLEAYEVDAQKNKWDEADEKYVPHLSTWLRNKRWENHTGEPIGKAGGVHIMTQLRKSDGIEDARQLRKEILEDHERRTKVAPKSMVRTYAKWLTGPDSPPATSKDSIKDVLITNRNDSRYWDAYVTAGMPGMTKTEEV